MTKTSGKKLNLLKSLEILQSNSFISFYHFNNLSKKEWDEIKLKLKEIAPLPKDLHLPSKGFSAKRREEIEVSVLVLKSKAVVKLLGPLLSATDNKKRIGKSLDSAPGFQSKGEPFANPGKGLLSLPMCANQRRANLETNLGGEENVFKDRMSSLKKALSLIEGPTLLIGASTVDGFRESAKRLEKEKKVVFVGGVLESQFINHLDLKVCLNLNLLGGAHLVQTLSVSLILSPLPSCSNKLLFLLQKRQKSLEMS